MGECLNNFSLLVILYCNASFCCHYFNPSFLCVLILYWVALQREIKCVKEMYCVYGRLWWMWSISGVAAYMWSWNVPVVPALPSPPHVLQTSGSHYLYLPLDSHSFTLSFCLYVVYHLFSFSFLFIYLYFHAHPGDLLCDIYKHNYNTVCTSTTFLPEQHHCTRIRLINIPVTSMSNQSLIYVTV